MGPAGRSVVVDCGLGTVLDNHLSRRRRRKRTSLEDGDSEKGADGAGSPGGSGCTMGGASRPGGGVGAAP